MCAVQPEPSATTAQPAATHLRLQLGRCQRVLCWVVVVVVCGWCVGGAWVVCGWCGAQAQLAKRVCAVESAARSGAGARQCKPWDGACPQRATSVRHALSHTCSCLAASFSLFAATEVPGANSLGSSSVKLQ